jgi:hypothetical protein
MICVESFFADSAPRRLEVISTFGRLNRQVTRLERFLASRAFARLKAASKEVMPSNGCGGVHRGELGGRLSVRLEVFGDAESAAGDQYVKGIASRLCFAGAEGSGGIA